MVKRSVFSSHCCTAVQRKKMSWLKCSNWDLIWWSNQFRVNVFKTRKNYLQRTSEVRRFRIPVDSPKLKFIYSEKATNFANWTLDKSKVKISQNFVAFSEYMNFTRLARKICKIMLLMEKNAVQCIKLSVGGLQSTLK